MKCIIIEDEKRAATHLEYLLHGINEGIVIQAKIDSVKNAVEWLKNNETDIIFLDVHIGDSISFAIFDEIEVNTPIIFTTAYDEYALKAFKLNSIDYLLKPVDGDELKEAIQKLTNLQADKIDYRKALLLEQANTYQKRFLVSSGNHIKSLAVEEVGYFYTQNKHLFITSMKGGQYIFEGTLETLEQKLDPSMFFRINRQYIISVLCISDMVTLPKGRVKIETQTGRNDEIIVSIDRAAEFRKWLNR